MTALCVKCGAEATTTFAQSATVPYCYACFKISIRLKFRAALAKPKRFRVNKAGATKNQRVLIIGESDTRLQTLIQLVHEAQHEQIAKWRFDIDATIYVVDSQTTETHINQLETFDLPQCSVHLSAALNASGSTSNETLEPKLDEYHRLLNSIKKQSTRAELCRLLFDKLLWTLAQHEDVAYVLTTETSTVLAHRTLDLMCFGRSQTTASICNVIDERNPACMIIRPLRNISDEELRFLCPTSTSTFTSTGDITTSNFMTNAQPNFPGTTTTVLSVVTKLSNTATTSEGSTKASIRCSVCFSSIADDQDTLCEPCCRYLSQFDAKESAQLKRCLNNKQLFYCFCWSSLLVYA